ncbi:ABC transporter ATP-binding protein [Lentzea albida]|uniref:ABC-2 type transport system ATP-binding protein n=1 Tax=Lentzea albida TaxID=65499 RepID=A0A1H9RDI4_9PSEU|nr:ABC transporter ATP-binding protein [Lentzea albida]SER70971.1 ABC-2 type transport system ATP-binding protein [Lentzea albida]
MNVISTQRLCKSYGRTEALRDLDLEVRPGEVYGLLGPNGAGKTTTLRLLVDVIRPTRGGIALFGSPMSPRLRGRIGYLPGDLVLYDRLTGAEYLGFCGALRDRPDPGEATRLAKRLDLDLGRRTDELSKGNRQKLGIVQAFAHRPDLAILDEPTSGLDPLAQREFHTYLREYVDDGGTVLFSSHVLSEVEHVADRVGILLDGRLVVEDAVASLKANAVRELTFAFAEEVAAATFSGVPGVREAVQVSGTEVRCRVSGAVGELVRTAARFPLVNVTSHEPDLEDIFVHYTEGLSDVR